VAHCTKAALARLVGVHGVDQITSYAYPMTHLRKSKREIPCLVFSTNLTYFIFWMKKDISEMYDWQTFFLLLDTGCHIPIPLHGTGLEVMVKGCRLLALLLENDSPSWPKL
jgi:hypothetical protein